ncbi:MAG: C45 family peptidase [Candidatus Bathyarchaeia archaeon]
MAFVPLKFEGKSYEIGYKRGKLSRYHIRFIAESGLRNIPNKEEKVLLSRHIEKMLKDNYPELIEELRGISDGSGIGYENMLLLNAWWDKPWWCSNVALLDTRLGPILGSTLDIGYSPELIMMHYEPEQGYSFINVGEITLVGAVRAMNEKGLCVGCSSVRATDAGEGFPRYTLLCVAVQYCTTVNDVIKLFEKFSEGLYNPGNYIFIDQGGHGVVIEQTNSSFSIRKAENSGIACTNHYETLEAQKYQYNGYDVLWLLNNSRERYKHLLNFINTANRERPLEDIIRLLKSHGPGGLCQHGEENQLCATVASIAMPRTLEFYVSNPQGFYCKSSFIKYTPFSD